MVNLNVYIWLCLAQIWKIRDSSYLYYNDIQDHKVSPNEHQLNLSFVIKFNNFDSKNLQKFLFNGIILK